jgi:hypothetical protein
MLNELSSEGAIPVIDWGCSTDSPFVTTTDIVNNTNDVDAYIRSYAEQLKAYGKPVFLRWLWEFNIESPPATFYRDCIETVPGTANPATDGPEYQLAFQDIWKIFKGPGGVGAANVSFVWNPGLAGNLNLSFLQQYYPGAQYVDWVGVDGYSRPVPTELMGNPIAANPTFPTLFTSIVNLLSTNFPDPIMIGETGATNQENTPTHQAVYLQGALTALQTPPFADVGAFNYYDATNNLLQGDDGTWTLTTASGGFQAFAAMGQSSYFSFTGSQ